MCLRQAQPLVRFATGRVVDESARLAKGPRDHLASRSRPERTRDSLPIRARTGHCLKAMSLLSMYHLPLPHIAGGMTADSCQPSTASSDAGAFQSNIARVMGPPGEAPPDIAPSRHTLPTSWCFTRRCSAIRAIARQAGRHTVQSIWVGIAHAWRHRSPGRSADCADRIAHALVHPALVRAIASRSVVGVLRVPVPFISC